jgi:hypothetical protein
MHNTRAAPGFLHQFPGMPIAEHSPCVNHISAEVAMLTERWLEFTEQTETLTRAKSLKSNA